MNDWRGVELVVGQTVIYGAGVGRSISPTVAEVVGLEPSELKAATHLSYSYDRVLLRVHEWAFGHRSDPSKPVRVMPERVTVIRGLPDCPAQR